MAKVKLQTFGEKAADFFKSLRPDFPLPPEFEFLLPYESNEVRSIINVFFNKYYNDNRSRIFILGINPGRFGAGKTGIAFTDPVKLELECGIENTMERKQELSSTFIYKMIEKYGGVRKFYDRFFLSAVCPVGFIKNGKNINYYDDKSLLDSGRSYIIETLKEQIGFGALQQVAICLGEGKNFKHLSELNKKYKFFDEIIPLAHPRFVMQYKLRQVDGYINKYVETLNSVE